MKLPEWIFEVLPLYVRRLPDQDGIKMWRFTCRPIELAVLIIWAWNAWT
ncbi:hypothetical protein [Rubellimicrobium arenae]|nr:hypothetical protein [Rubellimicrobium arenae]